jgi:hypothetical protein
MAKTPVPKKHLVPESFRQRNQVESERVVQLTQKALAQLEADHQTVTLTTVVASTRALDEETKGLSAKTILRNPEAARLFHEHSPAYQARQRRVRRAGRKRVQVNADARATYRGLRASDLISMVEDLKRRNAEIRMQRDKLQTERDEAYRLRDEALAQNTRQLAALTRLMPPSTQ